MLSKSAVDKHWDQQVPISEETQQLSDLWLAPVFPLVVIHQFSLIVQSLGTVHLQFF